MEPSKPPRVFISYSWESEDHKTWVQYLGEHLYRAGIEARLDQWDVQPGKSFTAFMEQEVAAADFVIVVCTPSYARKSNDRQGGVGYEQQIVSGQLMSGTARSKFIPILRRGEHEPGPDFAIPTHFLGIAWIEFRDDAAFDESLEDLIRVILSLPRFSPPPLGARPPLKTITTTILNRNRFTEADESIENDLEEADIDPKLDDASACHDSWRAYFVKGDYDRAIADYTKAVEIKPDYAPGYCGRGFAYSAKGDHDRAIADFTKAMEIEPDEARDCCYRGFAYYEKGDYDRAIADFTKAMEIDPDYSIPYQKRGIAYSAKGDKGRAIADLRKSLELFNYPGDHEDTLRELRRLEAE